MKTFTSARGRSAPADIIARPMARPVPSRTSWSGFGTAWSITTTLVAGIAVWGGIGFLLDKLIWSRFVLTALGVVVGAGAGIYIVYLRYGRHP